MFYYLKTDSYFIINAIIYNWFIKIDSRKINYFIIILTNTCIFLKKKPIMLCSHST